MNAIELLDAAATCDPEAAALMWGRPGREARESFGELAQRSRRIAALFRACGLRAGDAVAVFLPMAGPFYEVMAAILRLGMTAVFVDPGRWRDSLERTAAALPLRGLVATPGVCLARWLVPPLRRIPLTFVAGAAQPGAVSLRAADGFAPLEAVEPRADADLALLTFTSGSTGRPKGVRRSHGVLAATLRVLAREMRLEPRQVQLAVLPFFVFAFLGAGATSVIPRLDLRSPAATDPEDIARWIESRAVAGIVASPTALRRLARHCAATPRRLASLRTVLAGGAPVCPGVLDALHAAAPAARVGAVYGATEAEPMAIAEHADFGAAERRAIAAGRGLLAGRPVADVALRILTDGEIAVAGANVSPGYLDAEDDRAHKVLDGARPWHRTGDAGYLDPAGRLWLVGRAAGGIDIGGEVVHPLRVEAALCDDPHLSRATLVLHEGRRALVLEPAGDARDLDPARVAARVAWCRPEEIVLMRRIPVDRRHLAKVDRAALRDELSRRRWLARTRARLA